LGSHEEKLKNAVELHKSFILLLEILKHKTQLCLKNIVKGRSKFENDSLYNKY